MQIFIAHSVQLGEKVSFRHAKCRYVVHSWLANALEIGHAPVGARNDPASPQSSSRLIGRSSETHHRSEGPHATNPRPEYGRARTAYGASLANWGYADWTLQPSVIFDRGSELRRSHHHTRTGSWSGRFDGQWFRRERTHGHGVVERTIGARR
jgi:hypothetical protein